MKIVAILRDPAGRRIEEAVGYGSNGSEAIAALLASASRLAADNDATPLSERIQAALDAATQATLDAQFEEGGWFVYIQW